MRRTGLPGFAFENLPIGRPKREPASSESSSRRRSHHQMSHGTRPFGATADAGWCVGPWTACDMPVHPSAADLGTTHGPYVRVEEDPDHDDDIRHACWCSR